jgi:murein DD-endopeptidase MepM/ murein hydrolase activator NlpD
MCPNKNLRSRFGNIAAVALLIPLMMWGFWSESPLLPVTGAANKDWHPDTFWYEPWGSSGVHKGMDIFAPKGQMLVAPVPMLRLWRGELSKGGKVILALGPGFKLHYFAHLDSFEGNRWWLAAGSPIGTVGDSGNAKGKPPHLHYSLVSLLPRPWRLDFTTQGYKKVFYLDPVEYFSHSGI